MTTFKKIESKKKSTFAAEQIVESIGQNKYRVGDKLPSEREIAELMSVSRPSVREALSALQLVGIVESRPGDGTYVLRGINVLEEAYPAFSLLEESDSLHEAYEARRMLEEGIVALACRKANLSDLEKITATLEKINVAAAEEDFEALNHANRRFHLALANSAHNSLLVRALEPLLEVMHQRLPQKLRKSFYRGSQHRFEKTYAVHKKIVQAIEKKDQDQAVRALREHFVVLERYK